MDIERFNHAIALRDSGYMEQSLQVLEDLMRTTSNALEKATLVLNESTCLTVMGRFADARDRLHRATQLSANAAVRAEAEFGKAVLLWHERKPEIALAKLNRWIEDYGYLAKSSDLRGVYESVQVKRGLLLQELARFADALPVLQECATFQLQGPDGGDADTLWPSPILRPEI